jgi:hypothetical protein
MATTKDDLRQWFNEGLRLGATHMIVVCDTFDYDDYPVYVMPGEDAAEKAVEYAQRSMQKVMEVYKIALGEKQVDGTDRVFNF